MPSKVFDFLSLLILVSLFSLSSQESIENADPAMEDLQDAMEENERQLGTIIHDDPYDYFQFYTESEDWDRCVESKEIPEYEDGCYPIVSIEEAACRAELIVWGTVIDENSQGEVKILVSWRSPSFHDNGRKTIAKWGAGLDNSEEGDTIFYNDSGEFKTWVSGFSNSFCGTRMPIPGSEGWFFLKAIDSDPEEVFIDANKDLNLRFELVTTVFGSGTAAAIADSERWDYIRRYSNAFGPISSKNCEEIRCCYTPDCASCSSFDVNDCRWTTYTEPSPAANNSGVNVIAIIVSLAVFGLVGNIGQY